MLRPWRRSCRAAALLVFVAASGETRQSAREACEAAHPAAWGRAGKDVVWVPSFDAVVLAMLSITQVTPQDVVLDLGAGDGKIVIAAARAPFGARAIGIEYDADLVELAGCLVQAEGVADKVRIVQGDIFKEDFAGASVVTMYLLPQLNFCVRHRLLALEPGTRVASHQYTMGEWAPDRTVQVQGRDVHYWVVPARVDGVWDFEDSQGAAFAVELRQTFGAIAGEVSRGGGAPEAVHTASVHGRELRFSHGSGASTSRFSGTVRGGEITGVLAVGNAARTATGRLRGALRPAAWAEMPPDCGRYYDR